MIRFLVIFLFSTQAISQFNDTIFYASGMIKVVEVIDYDKNTIAFKNINSHGDTVMSYIGVFPVTHFVCYDNDGVLQYDSQIRTLEAFKSKQSTKYPDSAAVRHHQISINLLPLPVGIFNGHYSYTFGSKMQFSVLTRLTYSPEYFSFSNLVWNYGAGLGFKLTPYYSERFSFGIDITPVIGFKPEENPYTYIYIPLSINLHYFISSRIGLSFDAGLGQVYHNKKDDLLVRGNFGMMFQFGNKKLFKTDY